MNFKPRERMTSMVKKRGGVTMKVFFAVLVLLTFFWPVFHGSAAFAADVFDVFVTEVGDAEVGMLSEGQSEGDPGILVGAAQADIAKFIPSGRQATAVAVYAVRTKDGPMLIDTGGTLGDPGKPIAGGILPIAAYGHTPGHTMFMIESAGQKLLFWGDLTHAMQIQMPRPGVSVTYDSDPVEAARTRKDVLRFVAENDIPVAGMHVPFPGIGRVKEDGGNPGGYVFLPFEE
jgi:hypothetical protein